MREPPGEWGTTLRFYDPAIDAWRSTWIGPRKHVVMPFLARQVGDEIVLEGSFQEGSLTRWIFSDVTPATFHSARGRVQGRRRELGSGPGDGRCETCRAPLV